MNKYDTVKESFELSLLNDFHAPSFHSGRGQKGQPILVCKPRIPAINRITIDEEGGRDKVGEVTLEFSSKVLGHRYPLLISNETIHEAHYNINKTGLVSFDTDKVLETAQALKIHQTSDIRLPRPLPEYGRVVRQLWIPNGYLLRNNARGKNDWQSFSFQREIQENSEYLKFYKKFRELSLSRNKEFFKQLTPKQQNQIISHFLNVTRLELCLSGGKKIKQHYTDVSPELLLKDVLNSKVDALSNLYQKLISSMLVNIENTQAIDFASTLTDMKQLNIFTALFFSKFDIDATCEHLKLRCKRANFYTLRPKHEEMLRRYLAHQSGKHTQDLLNELTQAVSAGSVPMVW
jgi:hypothetical protein